MVLGCLSLVTERIWNRLKPVEWKDVMFSPGEESTRQRQIRHGHLDNTRAKKNGSYSTRKMDHTRQGKWIILDKENGETDRSQGPTDRREHSTRLISGDFCGNILDM
jgi:hypothetical protein